MDNESELQKAPEKIRVTRPVADEKADAQKVSLRTNENGESAGKDPHSPASAELSLSDPSAKEHEWIPALIELSNKDKILPKPLPKRSYTSTLVSIALIVGCIGFGGWYLSLHGHASAPAPLPSPSSAPSPAPVGTALKHEQPDFGPYMADLQHNIKSHWHPPKSNDSHKIMVHFKVKKTGEISDIGFDRLSPESAEDAAALKAVIESMGSAPALPMGSPESVSVSFTFEYNVTRSGDHPAEKIRN